MFWGDLRKLQSWLYELADPELIVVYAESQARGVSDTTYIKTLTAHWDNLQSNVTSLASRILRYGLYQDVVILFVHHTSEVVQSSLLRTPGFWLSTLPTERHVHGKQTIDVTVLKEYPSTET